MDNKGFCPGQIFKTRIKNNPFWYGNRLDCRSITGFVKRLFFKREVIGD